MADADDHEKDVETSVDFTARRYETLDLTQVEELDERMQKLTHKLENARRDFVRAASDGRVRRELNESVRALACFDSFVEVGPPQAGTADRCRRGRAEKERERGGGDGDPRFRPAGVRPPRNCRNKQERNHSHQARVGPDQVYYRPERGWGI